MAISYRELCRLIRRLMLEDSFGGTTMRRLFVNLFVSFLTFVLGVGASVMQNVFTPSSINTGTTRVAADIEIPKDGYSPAATACRCGEEPSTSPAELSPAKAPISGGVLNDKAINLPQPAYPPVAKAARQSGTVVVQVTIDERGCVVAARAASGPPLLQAAAVKAAYQARFSPTKLSGQPVKVTGVITYNFVLE